MIAAAQRSGETALRRPHAPLPPGEHGREESPAGARPRRPRLPLRRRLPDVQSQPAGLVPRKGDPRRTVVPERRPPDRRSCWWTGSRVAAVKALVDSRFFEFSADDVAMALLQFENGVYSTLIHVWWKTGGRRLSTEFVCTEGMIQLRNGIESNNDDLFIARDETAELGESRGTRNLRRDCAATRGVRRRRRRGKGTAGDGRVRPPRSGGHDRLHGVLPLRQGSGDPGVARGAQCQKRDSKLLLNSRLVVSDVTG